MAEQKTYRLRQVAKKLNVGVSTIADFLASKGFEVESSPNFKISEEQNRLLIKEFKADMELVQEAQEMTIGGSHSNVVIDSQNQTEDVAKEDEDELITVYDRKADYVADENASSKEQDEPADKPEAKEQGEKKEEAVEEKKKEDPVKIETKKIGLKVMGKIELDAKNRPVKKPKVDKEPVVADEEKQETVKQEQPKKQEKKVEEKVAAKEEVKKEPVKQESVVEPVEEKNPAKEEVKPETKVEEISTNTKITEDVPTSKVEEKVIEEPIQKVEVQKEEEKKVEETPNTKEKQKPVARQEDVVKEQSIKNLEEEVVVEKEKHTSPKNIQPKKDIKEPVDTNTPVEEAQNTPAEEGEEEQTPEKLIQAKAEKLQGLKIIGKIELPKEKSRKGKPVASSDDKDKDKRKRKRKRVKKAKSGPIGGQQGQGGGNDRNDRNNRNDNRNDNRNNDRNDRNDNRNKDNNSNSRDKDGHKKDNSGANQQKGGGDSNKKRGKNRRHKEEVSQKEVDSSYKKTMAKMSGNVKNTRSSKSKYRREKRQAKAEERDQQMQQAEQEALTLKVTEFISTSELATLMDVSVNDVITKCLGLGMFVSINQRLDAEAITIIADEFGFEVDFSSAEEEVDVVLEEEDKEEDLVDRAPIVTIMGHVDHGKTSLLDYIRSAQVAEGEAGGITQHIGAYDVVTESGRRIVFLDTPGHEAFTAMRARGAKVTDVVIIVIAADDNVMPQTVEALNHAQVAGVPFVIAINKVDKPGANPDNIRSQLANMNILVESWGGKIQEQEISAKTGQGIEDLLELVLLESDILELKANPDKKAIGTVIEASLDKGKGYVSTVLIEAGTLQVGDIILSGSYYGRVKAMTDHRATRLKKAGPATPIQVLGLNGAPQAGDKFNAMDSEREAREIATKRSQIMREQSIRATKRTTLSDLGRRIALGNFHQLNIILKGDVDGSIEALSDSLLKLSTDEVEVNIIHKAVGPISESDVYLATTSDAIVIGFQVRPVASARRLADKEEVEIRLYSVIYDAINDVKDAMEGLLSPDIEEEIVGNIEVREVFKISKVGTVAGCYVTSGYVKRNSKVRLIRDGIVVYGGETGGEINALKRFKDDVNEVKQSFECGLSIKNYNDIKVGDIVEVFELKELKRTL